MKGRHGNGTRSRGRCRGKTLKQSRVIRKSVKKMEQMEEEVEEPEQEKLGANQRCSSSLLCCEAY